MEQLKLLDAAIDDDDILDSDSLHFPENDNMNLTDNDEYVSLEEATSIILNSNPHQTDDINTTNATNNTQSNDAGKSIFENDTDDENNKLHIVTASLNNNNNTTETTNNSNDKGENDKDNPTVITMDDKKKINKKD